MESPKLFLLIRNPFAKNSEDFQLSISSTDTILHVKTHLSQHHPERPSPSRQKLICAGKILADTQKLDEKDISAPQVVHLVINRGPAVDIGTSNEEKRSTELRSSAPASSTPASTLTYRPVPNSQPVSPFQYPAQQNQNNPNLHLDLQQQQQLAQFYLQQMQRQYAHQQQQQQQQAPNNNNNNAPQQQQQAPVVRQLHIHLNFGTILKGLVLLYLLSLREPNPSTLFFYAVIGLQSLLVGQPGARPLQHQGVASHPPGIIGELVNFFVPLVLSLFPSWNVDQYFVQPSPAPTPAPPTPNVPQPNNNNPPQPPVNLAPQLQAVEQNNVDFAEPL